MGVTSKRVPDGGVRGGRGQIVMGWKLSTCERASQADPEAPGALPSLVICASPNRDLLNALSVPI